MVVVEHPANASTGLVSAVNGRIAQFSPADVARRTEELLESRPDRRAVTAYAKTYDWQTAAATLQEVYTS